MDSPPNTKGLQELEKQALTVYRKCRDSTGEYRSLANQVRQLANTLQDLQDLVNERGIEGSKHTVLAQKSQDCGEVLADLDAVVTKYNNLPLQSKRTWERMSWEQQEGQEIRTRLASSAEGLQAFYDDFAQDPQVKIEQALEQLAAEIRGGRADASSVVTLGTSDSSSIASDDSGWAQVVRDLEDLGISESIAAENRSYIVEWIIRAINLGWLEEKVPVTETTMPIRRTPSPIRPAPAPLPTPAPAPLAIRRRDTPQTAPPPSTLSPPPQYTSRVPTRATISNEDLRARSGSADDTPPSPLGSEREETNIIWTAQKIVHFWNLKDWTKSREHLQEQLGAVRRGQTIYMNGKNVAPDARILHHLIAITYSFAGDFIQAKEMFQNVLHGVYINGLPLDDGDIAAARWLGETCIHLNEPTNAALAWAIALHGMQNKSYAGLTPRFMKDVRLLNNYTRGLNSIKTSFSQNNHDPTTILPRMSATDKYNVAIAALKYTMYGQDAAAGGYYRHSPPVSVTVAEGFLIQPLISQTSWPIPQDPFFCAQNAMNLLSQLTRPKQAFNYTTISTMNGLSGASKSLLFTTKNGAEWLVTTVQQALNTYAIEYKISGSMFLCRLSHSYNQIAYYECYAVYIRKLPFRNVYGIKISEKLYSTRGFVPSLITANGEEQERGLPVTEEDKRRMAVKAELADRLKSFLMQAETAKAEGRPFPPENFFPPKAPFELGSASMPKGRELHGESLTELDGTRRVNIPELPG